MDLNRPNFGIHEFLVLSEVPLGSMNLRGKKLIEAGALGPGTYACSISTSGLSAIDVYLEPTAVNAGGTPQLASFSLQANPAVNRTTANSHEQQTVTLDVAGGAVAFVANTVQKLSLTGLNGTALCKLSFTVTTSIDFTVATTHGRAEVRGL